MMPYIAIAGSSEPTSQQQLRESFASGAWRNLGDSGASLMAPQAVARFFRQRNYRPAWTGASAEPSVRSLQAMIEDMASHGLRPDDYHRHALRRALLKQDQLAIEMLATDAYIAMAAHLGGGRIDPISVEPDWTFKKTTLDPVALLRSAMRSGRVDASLARAAPRSDDYQVLRRALLSYQNRVSQPREVARLDGPDLKFGDRHSAVRDLRHRLTYELGLLSQSPDPLQFDAELEIAVAAYQRRVGLEPDGIVGARTREALNRSPQELMSQIRANLERWRWLPRDLGDKHIWVNIADFRLQARELGEPVRVHDVIVGQSYRKTPVFSGEIAYIVLNPWWVTPAKLARTDELALFQRDPLAVKALGFDVLDLSGRKVDADKIDWSRYTPTYFPFQLRQRPGPHNALGQVKIIFPNKHAVYLHDTPARHLFSRRERAYSSGCVRVRNAIDLAQWLLADTPGWQRSTIDGVLRRGDETRVVLSAKVPVHILYFTAVATPDGGLRFLDDVYTRDPRLIQALDAPLRGH